MNPQDTKTYWRSVQERDNALPLDNPRILLTDDGLSRRRFLEAAGFALGISVVTGCGRAPVTTALPLVAQPEGLVPGKTRHYATTCAGCSAACGMLVGVRDGRPLKMEGLSEHPLSQGGLCAVGQATPIELYDRLRLRQPLAGGKASTWSEVDARIDAAVKLAISSGSPVRLVTTTVTSPTLKFAIDAFLGQFVDGRHVTCDAVSSSAIIDAHELTHSCAVLPHYLIQHARVLCVFGADFLGTWISPVEFTAGWRSRRVPSGADPEMSYHVQFEGRMSLSGSKADARYRLAPDEYGIVLSHVAVQLSQLAGKPPLHGTLGTSPLDDRIISDLAQRLWNARTASLVMSDSDEIQTQVLVNYVNELLGNYGTTLDIQHPSRQRQGRDGEVMGLIDELEAGKVGALFVVGADFTQNLPRYGTLSKALKNVPLVVTFAEREDDLSEFANYVCPDHHPLESWLDAEPIKGLVTLRQPMLQPLNDTRSVIESLARWSGRSTTAYDELRIYWEKYIWNSLGAEPFTKFWDQVVHDGFVERPNSQDIMASFNPEHVKLVEAVANRSSNLLVLYSKVGMPGGQHAHNPWLHELPDPITKVTWDNYVCVSPAKARELRVTQGQVVRVTSADTSVNVELPVFIQPGQHDRVIAIALGYGVRGTDRFAKIGPEWLEARPTVAQGDRIGKNVAAFLRRGDRTWGYHVADVTVTSSNRHHDLASTQHHHSLTVPRNVAPLGAEVRDHVQVTTLGEYAKDQSSGAPHSHHAESLPLWPADHPTDGHRWGIVIDLNACTGCSACLIACQSENNVPVVGKDEIRRQREMHWLRIDRYYSGEDDDAVEVVHQPMMCQHCENAPCETVCPVLATVHSDEGLNEQVYNRCVGTRYCANNCPYKVRRFNWFDYTHDDTLQNLVLNPDVTVRTRGVMEKCSFCVQRIEEGKVNAKRLGELLVDGNILTACQQSCPAKAILFGDLNDKNSAVHAAWTDPRRYRVLEEFNFGPSVGYLRVIRNRESATSETEHHA